MATQMEICKTHAHAPIKRLLRAAVHPLSRVGCNVSGISAIIFLLLVQSVYVRAQDDKQVDLQVNAPLANAVLLQLKPNRCVALHQGQVCYQDIQLLWSTPQVGHYCLYQQNSEQPLHCWQSVNAGEYRYEFASDASMQIQLVNAQTKTVIAQAELEVAWVYKTNTRRKTHWRLF
jgi:hypothetical protein